MTAADRPKDREDDLITFKELLDRAHGEGLQEIETKVLQLPSKENGMTTIVAAKVTTKKGSFTATGDASPESVGAEVALHAVRVAETRGIARALRFALNVGDVAREELSANDRTVRRRIPGEPLKSPVAQPTRSRGDVRDARNANPEPSELAMTSAQRKLCFRLAYATGAKEDAARELVLRHLGVDRLEYATRAQASRAIDSLKRLQSGAPQEERGESRSHGRGMNGHA